MINNHPLDPETPINSKGEFEPFFIDTVLATGFYPGPESE